MSSKSVLSQPSSKEHKVPLQTWRKITFGMGGFGIGVIRGVSGLFQMAFLLEVVQLDPIWAGVVLFTEQIIDALTDPVVGFLSDYYPTPWGRRKPWIYLALPLTLILWIFSWLAPGELLGSQMAQIGYYLPIYIAFSTCLSFVIVPYLAIIPDIAPFPYERTTVVLYYETFLVLGATVASFIWSSSVTFTKALEIIPDAGMEYNYRLGYAFAGSVSAFTIFLSTFIGTAFVAEIPIDYNQQTRLSDPSMLLNRPSIFQRLKESIRVFTFPLFFLVTIIHGSSMLSLSFFMSNIYLYIKYVLLAEDYTNYFFLTIQVRTKHIRI